MPKYENGIIYKLKHYLDYDDLNIYIGSTCNFKHRKNGHKTCCNNEKSTNYNLFVYKYIRDNGGWDDWVMTPIEKYSCDSKKELEIKERYYIDLLRPTLNKQIPTRTFKEWYENNKGYYKEYRENNKEKVKEYYENNKEKILISIKTRYENNKEIINQKQKEYNEANKKKINKYKKEYYENNKEIINQKVKEFYEKNKEIINQKVICDHCGCEITKKYLKRHQKTKKCLNNKKI